MPKLTDEDLDYEDTVDGCWKCGGQGFTVVCVDDICRGLGYCIHGDGEEPCSECGDTLCEPGDRMPLI